MVSEMKYLTFNEIQIAISGSQTISCLHFYFIFYHAIKFWIVKE